MTHNLSFWGLIASPIVNTIYLPYSTGTGGTIYYWGGFKWTGSVFEYQEAMPEECDPIDITAKLATITSPANNDKINPTGVSITGLGIKLLKFNSTTGRWHCGS